MSDTDGYCIAAVGQDGEPKKALAPFDDVLAYLRATYNALANVLKRIAPPLCSRV